MDDNSFNQNKNEQGVDLDNSLISSSISHQKKKIIKSAKNYREIINFGLTYSFIISSFIFLINIILLLYSNNKTIKYVSTF